MIIIWTGSILAGFAVILFITKHLNSKKIRRAVCELEAGNSIPEALMTGDTGRLLHLYKEQIIRECGNSGQEHEVKFKVLQNQVNPHFLYNTLESIRSVAICEGVEGLTQIASMTEALAQYFRYNISYKTDLVTLEDELENVKRYMFIQCFRFSNRFRLEIKFQNCDETVCSLMLPKLILQPVIENAIFHGLETKTEQGLITVIITETTRGIIIVVEDDGVGIADKMLFQIQKSIHSTEPMQSNTDSDHNGVALWQINQEIKALFGGEYGIQIYSTFGLGTSVHINLPHINSQPEEERGENDEG